MQNIFNSICCISHFQFSALIMHVCWTRLIWWTMLKRVNTLKLIWFLYTLCIVQRGCVFNGFWRSLIVSNSNSIRHIYPTRDRSQRSILILELNFVYFVICRLCKCNLLRFLQVLFCLVFGNSTFICVIITLIII